MVSDDTLPITPTPLELRQILTAIALIEDGQRRLADLTALVKERVGIDQQVSVVFDTVSHKYVAHPGSAPVLPPTK